jgi:aminoglycoside phosphotransferase (APT) family kinase protein
MEFLPGEPLATGDAETLSEILGKAHAELHDIDPGSVVKALRQKNIDAYRYGLDRQFDYFVEKSEKLSWIRETVEWLVKNRPPEPKRLVVCHGDFHWLNILLDKGRVTGVLDWPNAAIADPVYDVAMTMMLISIPIEHVATALGFPPGVDWQSVAKLYLAAYRKYRFLDDSHLDYYQVEHCVEVLIKGSEGQKVWQQPLIRQGIVEYIQKNTGIFITVPAASLPNG